MPNDIDSGRESCVSCRRNQIRCFTILLCFLLSVACNRMGGTTYPAPPLTTYRMQSISMSANGSKRAVHGAFVTPQYIQAVRIQPLLGRFFLDADYQSDSAAAVLSYKLWQDQFAADPAIIGKKLDLNGRASTVVGIMPKGFEVPDGVEIWLPETASGR